MAQELDLTPLRVFSNKQPTPSTCDGGDFSIGERVIQYFKTCHGIIDDNGWRVFFDDSTDKKQLCRILIASLEPQALREDVERTVRFQ
ncbi:hypothetical protein F441_13486, partial [Phytophthora nicotianae CJ01A1]